MNSSKNIVVVGASSGIGLRLTEQLLEEHHQVFSISRSEVHALPQVVHHSADVVKDDLSHLVLPEVVHGLVYCPGSIVLKPFNRITTEDLMRAFELNLLGAVRTIQAVLPALKKADRASLVLFSTVAVATGMPFHTVVAAAKGAVEGFGRALAAELAPKITVNIIAPSLTDTPLASTLLSTPEKREASAKRHPLATVGTTDQQAAMAKYLLTTDHWMTAQVLHVDGGMSGVRLL
jgi:3-oxoacyl-[acyl-carrier protein] reductase